MHKKIRLICALLCFLYPVLSSASTPVLTPALPVSEAPLSTQQAVLEAKLNAEKEIRQKDQETIEVQIQGFDKRIGDIGSSIDRFGILLTVFGGLLTALLVGLGYLSFRKAGEDAEKAAKEAADQWFKNNNEALDSKLKSLDSKVKALEVEIKEKHNKIKSDFNELGEKNQVEIQAQPSNLTGAGNPSESTEEARKSNEALAKEAELLRHKPEAKYSFDDWNARAVNALIQQDLTAAVMYWTGAAKVEDASELQIAQALFKKGFTLSNLKRFVEAIDVCREVIFRFGEKSELRELVAQAMVSKGFALGNLADFDGAIDVYDKVIKRFGEEIAIELRELVARAMLNKSVMLSSLDRFDEALVTCNDVISRCDEAPKPEFSKLVAQAMVSKGFVLVKLGSFYDAIDVSKKVISLFGEEPELREQVAQAMVNKGFAFDDSNEHEKAIAAYDDVIEHFGKKSEPELREPVARAMGCKAFTLSNLSRVDEAIVLYGEVIERFGKEPEPELQKIVANAKQLRAELSSPNQTNQ